MEKISKLTKEQTDRFQEYVDKWTKIGLSTEICNKDRSEIAINQVYQCADLEAPKYIIWSDSPVTQGLIYLLLKTNKISLDDLTKAVDGEFKISNKLSKKQIKIKQKLDVIFNLEAKNNYVSDQHKSIIDFLITNVDDSILQELSSTIWNSCYGQHNANWLGFYEYFKEVCGLIEETKKLSGLINAAKEVGWFIPTKDICFVSRRPSALRLDEQGRLHNLNGPALQYLDGWSLFYVHGIKVPKWIISNPNDITADKIDEESNAEIRRVMLDIFGHENYLMAGNFEVLDIDTDQFGRQRRLLKKKSGLDEDIVRVEVLNSSPEPQSFLPKTNEAFGFIKEGDLYFRKYYLAVHPELRLLIDVEKELYGSPQKMTCLNGVASTFGMTGEEYKILIET